MGGGAGGGSSSGMVDYPDYVKGVHYTFLAGTGNITINPPVVSSGNNLIELFDNAINNNPWLGTDAYNPSTEIIAMATALNTLTSSNSAAIAEYESSIDNLSSTIQIESELSAFDIGMRNVNAVHGSGFIIGRTLIASGLLKEKLIARQALAQFKLEAGNREAALGIEVARIGLVAHKEERDMNNELDHKFSVWDFDILQMAGNVLAAISGGTVSVPKDGPSKTQSAIGGGLSGAAAGAMVGSAIPGVGTAIGAAVGGTLGIAQAFL